MASIFINYAMVDMDRMLDDAVPIGLCTLYLQGCFHERTGDASGYAVKFNSSPDVRALSKKQSQRWRKRAWLLPFVATAPVICKALTFAALSGT